MAPFKVVKNNIRIYKNNFQHKHQFLDDIAELADDSSLFCLEENLVIMFHLSSSW